MVLVLLIRKMEIIITCLYQHLQMVVFLLAFMPQTFYKKHFILMLII